MSISRLSRLMRAGIAISLTSAIAFTGFFAAAPASANTSTTVATSISGQSNKEAKFTATIFHLLNEDRIDKGLKPLERMDELDVVAQNWSKNMATEELLYHNPIYIAQIPSNWATTAENISFGPTKPEETYQSWVNSPKHNANMFNPEHTHIGIGVAFDRNGRAYTTQNFASFHEDVRWEDDYDQDDFTEPREVYVVPPIFHDKDGVHTDVYVIPVVEGVRYFVNGAPARDGLSMGSGTITVTAELASDRYYFSEDTDALRWTYTFSTEGAIANKPNSPAPAEPAPEPEPEQKPAPAPVTEVKPVPAPKPSTPSRNGIPSDDGSSTRGIDDGGIGGTGNQYFLNDKFSAYANKVYRYGNANGRVYVGDWNGDGKDTLAYRIGNTFYVRNSNTAGAPNQVFAYGRKDDRVYVGDWNGDGKDTFAVRRGKTYHVKNTLGGGNADAVIHYGRADDDILVGDWDGDRKDTFAVRRGSVYHVKNSMAGGKADQVVNYGRKNDDVYVGDWDGKNGDSFAVRRGSTYFIANKIRGGAADFSLNYGRKNDTTLVGDWNGDGKDTLGIRRS